MKNAKREVKHVGKYTDEGIRSFPKITCKIAAGLFRDITHGCKYWNEK
jgi:hypothetical protein